MVGREERGEEGRMVGREERGGGGEDGGQGREGGRRERAEGRSEDWWLSVRAYSEHRVC